MLAVYLDRIFSYLNGHFKYQKSIFSNSMQIVSVLFGRVFRSTLAVVLETIVFILIVLQ